MHAMSRCVKKKQKCKFVFLNMLVSYQCWGLAQYSREHCLYVIVLYFPDACQSSPDIAIVAGIALAILFVLCSLEVLMMLYICKMRSKATPHPLPVPDTRYEMMNFDLKNNSLELHDNSAYGTARCK